MERKDDPPPAGGNAIGPPVRRLGLAPVVLEKDPVCGMMVRADAPQRATFEGKDYVFCCAKCRERFIATPRTFLVPPPAALAAVAQPAAPSSTSWTCPDAPRRRARARGHVPDLRHGARAAVGGGRGRQPGAHRHDEAARRERRADGAAHARRHGAHAARRPRARAREGAPVDRAAAGDARRAVGRMAVLRARGAVDRAPQPQHVHAHRPGRGRRLPRQRRRRRAARRVPGVVPRRRGSGRRVLRGRGSNRHARAARAGARAPRARAHGLGAARAARPRPQAGAPPARRRWRQRCRRRH